MRTQTTIQDIAEYLRQTRAVIAEVSAESLVTTVSRLYDAWAHRKQIFVIGNGGSASTASHIANDLSKATIVSGMPRMRVVGLTDNVAVMTAWANDVSYDCVFREQLENLLNPGDTVIAISASGNSPNVLRAIEFARQQGAVTIGWTGQSGGRLKHLVDHCAHAPTEDVGMIESVHLVFVHLVTRQLASRILVESMSRAVGNAAGSLSSFDAATA